MNALYKKMFCCDATAGEEDEDTFTEDQQPKY